MYRVEFAIDVPARSYNEACKRAWELLAGPESGLPVGTVTKFDDQTHRCEDVDLQELAERKTK
jgi:hypothetical protein